MRLLASPDMRLFSSFFILASASLCLFAQAVRKPVFVSPEQLPVASVLANPPNDAQTAAELAGLHEIEQTRTPAQIAHAKADDAEEDIFIFKNVMGDKFTAEALPLTALLSTHVHGDEGLIVNPAKKFFHRLRPYHFDSSLKPVCKTNPDSTDYGYPSGHSVTGYLEALVLTMMVPEKRDAILARADDYAHSRVVCGVHYPSDVVASKSVAYAMIGIIMNNPQFQKELESAKAEIHRALMTPRP
jgi:acid phosphatase (class A)